MKQKYVPVVAIACLLIITHMVAISVVGIYPREYRAFGEDTDNPLNPLIYVVFIILFTGFMLLVMKYTKGNFIHYALLAVVGLTLFYVFYPVLFHLTGINDMSFYLAIVFAILLTTTLYKYPEWYVVDGIGIVMGAGIAAILGFSLGILPVLVLLIVLAVYDAISVYKTKHMISLADGVVKLKLPILLVIPHKLSYRFFQEEGLVQHIERKKKREAMFIGLGDLIIPGILPVSASIYLPGVMVGGLYAPYVVAVGASVGSVCGLLVLMRYVLKGNPQAGLPLLNSGVILGYAITYLVMYRDLTFGIAYPW